MSPAHYHVPASPFAHQEIEGEIVIVNVESGVYYSLRGTGAIILAFLQRGASVDEVAGKLEERFEADSIALVSSVQQLVDELLKEGLLVAGRAPELAPVEGLAALAPPTVKAPFEKPLLERFTDMKDLLLLDPIHEVGDQGWPIVKDPGA